jgi:general secretion pathway protein K
MVDPGELRLVKGVTPALFEALKPYITALPAVTPVNILSAEPPVLAILGSGLTLDTAKVIHDMVTANPPATMQAFMALDIIKNHPIPEAKATLTSTYFLVETEVTIERQHIVLYTLMQRNTGSGKAEVTILWQNRGTG